MVEGALVCLERRGVRWLGDRGGMDGNGYEGVILVRRLYVSWRKYGRRREKGSRRQ